MKRAKSRSKRVIGTSRRARLFGAVVIGIGLLAPLGVAGPAAAASQIYEAVAFSPSLKVVREGNGATASDAQMVALNACLAYANQHLSDYYKDCAPYGWVNNGFIGFASSGRAPGELDWAWGSGWGHIGSQAAQNAVNTCKNWGGGQSGKAPCLQVGGSPFRSPVYNSSAPTTGGGKSINWTTAPLPPTDLSVQMVNPTTIRLSWLARSSDTQTPPSYWEVNNGNVSRQVTPQTVTYNWTVRPNEYMCFHVRAVNSVGSSWWEPNVSPWYRCAGSVSY